MNSYKKKILCIGAGYVGGQTMTIIANKCPEHKVTVADISEERIAAWNSEKLPIFEPGLNERVEKARGRNLFFTTDVDAGILEADIIFVCVNTPTKTFGQGAGMAADLSFIEKTARRIKEVARSGKIVVEKSTVPVRAAETIGTILHSGDGDVNFEILSNPEFLAEGTAIPDMENPDRVLIGSQETPSGLKARRELFDIYSQWVPKEKIITSNLWSSELSKLVSNAFLAQRISSINSIASVCELTGADVTQVSRAVGKDSRIGEKFLRAGVGFGGSCFRKDILNLVYLSQHYGLSEVADFWSKVISLNEFQMERFVQRITRAMFNTLVDKKIAVFGFAFKPDTGDTRDSPAIYICKRLLQERAKLCISDPHAIESARRDLANVDGKITYELNPYKAADGADGIVLLTEWKSFETLNYKRIFESMEKPAFCFDGRNCLDHDALYDLGFNLYCVGRPDRHHL